MACIAINDIRESESFLTELNDTDLAMNQIHGGEHCPEETTTTTTATTTVVVVPRRRPFLLGLVIGAILPLGT